MHYLNTGMTSGTEIHNLWQLKLFQVLWYIICSEIQIQKLQLVDAVALEGCFSVLLVYSYGV